MIRYNDINQNGNQTNNGTMNKDKNNNTIMIKIIILIK